MNTAKKIVRNILPPLIYNGASRLKKRLETQEGFYGDYNDYNELIKKISGYELPEIVEFVSGRTEKYIADRKNSVYLSEAEQKLLTPFSLAVQFFNQEINVLDFGGALGKDFYLIDKFTDPKVIKSWTICEMPRMAKKGEESYTTDKLKFSSNIHNIEEKIDIIITSGSLQYVASPEDTYEAFANLNPKFIIINRVPFIEEEKDRLTIQIASQKYHGGTIAAWFLSRPKWTAKFSEKYDIIMKWDIPQDIVVLDKKPLVFEGLLLKRRDV